MSSSKKKSQKRVRAPDSESDCESEPPSSGDDSDKESASASTVSTIKSKPKKKQKVMIDLESGNKAGSKSSTKAKPRAAPKTLASSKTSASTSSTSSTSSKMSGVIFNTTSSPIITPTTDSAAVANVLMSALAPDAKMSPYHYGQKVVARWKSSYPFGQRYNGIITAIHSDGKLTIRYADGDVWINAPADAIVSATPMPISSSSSVTTVSSSTSGQQAQHTTGTKGETGFLLDTAMRKKQQQQQQQQSSTNSTKSRGWISGVVTNVVNYMNGGSDTLPTSTASVAFSLSNSQSSLATSSSSDPSPMNIDSTATSSAYNISGVLPSSTFDSPSLSSSINTTAPLSTLETNAGITKKVIDLTDPEQVETLSKLRFKPPHWRRCGLEPYMFVSDAKQQDDSESIYTCPVCQMVAWRPVAFHPCGHVMCFDCLEGQKNTASSCLRVGSKYKCPTCRAVSDNAPTENNALVKKIFADFKIHCPGQSEYEMGTKKSQCDYVGNYWEAAQHLLKCPFETVECTCKQAMPRKELEKHKETECSLRTSKCQHCGEFIMASLMDTHKSLSCLATTVANVWCKLCKKHIDKGSFVEHMAESMLLHAKALATTEECTISNSTSSSPSVGASSTLDTALQTHVMQAWLGKTVDATFGDKRFYGKVEALTYWAKAKKWTANVRYDDGDCYVEDLNNITRVMARSSPTATFTEAKAPQYLAWFPAPYPRSGIETVTMRRLWSETLGNSLSYNSKNHIYQFLQTGAKFPTASPSLFPAVFTPEFAAMYREPVSGSGSGSA